MRNFDEKLFSDLEFQRLESIAAETREPHWRQLPEPQELYLELLVRKGTQYLITSNGRHLGYVIETDQILVEFYLADPWLPYLDDIFQMVVSTLQLRKAAWQSFDAVLLRAALTSNGNITPIGHLFRERVKTPVQHIELERQLAAETDIAWVRDVNEDIFESLDEIEITVGNRNLFIYSQTGKRIGFGIFQRTLPERNWFDIGMLVLTGFRRRGLGTAIISDLAEHCRVNDWRPTCGCDINNLASKRTLEKAGFISKYLMLGIEF